MAAAPPDGNSNSPLFLCTVCWKVFEDGSLEVCPDEHKRCRALRPATGWEVLPYRFRRFQFLRLLGRGGMGAVFLAHDLEAKAGQHDVAVKVVQRVGTPEDLAAQIRRFEREIRVANALSQHPHFVQVLANDVLGEVPYLAMEYVPWATLTRFRGSTQLPPLQVARLGVALLEGLKLMHFRNYVHRDLKPDNLFVGQFPGEYQIKITDLGICADDQQAKGAPPPGSIAQTIMGTPSYMSPEQVAGGEPSCRSDLHAVGSILWELATGQVPYPFSRKEAPDVAFRKRCEMMLQLPIRPPQLPEELFRILCGTLAFDWRHRTRSAAELSEQLTGFINGWRAAEQEAIEQNRLLLAKLNQRLQPVLQELEGQQQQLSQGQQLAAEIRELQTKLPEWQPVRLRQEVKLLEPRLDHFVAKARGPVRPCTGLAGRSWLLLGLGVFGLALAAFWLGWLVHSPPPIPLPVPPVHEDAGLVTLQPDAGPGRQVDGNTAPDVQPASRQPVRLELRTVGAPADKVLVNGQEVCRDRIPHTPCPIQLNGSYPVTLAVEAVDLQARPPNLVLPNEDAAVKLGGSFAFQWEAKVFVP